MVRIVRNADRTANLSYFFKSSLYPFKTFKSPGDIFKRNSAAPCNRNRSKRVEHVVFTVGSKRYFAQLFTALICGKSKLTADASYALCIVGRPVVKPER